MIKIKTDIDNVSIRRTIESGTEEQRRAVADILERVKRDGDQALLDYARQLDGIHLQDLRVSEAEFQAAWDQVEPELMTALRQAGDNIRSFHQKQIQNSWMHTTETGSLLGLRFTPLERVGVYVPAGTADLVSSVLMTVIPAQVAGVREIVMMTPPKERISPGLLAAAQQLNIKEIYKVGGAQAIGALTYGTETIRAVDKIVGPGNIYVALAKRAVFGLVDIDMIAGPSEIIVLADEYQNPAYIAADLLSQAEHDPLSAAICVTPSANLAERVQAEVERQLSTLPRREIAQASLEQYGAIYVTRDLEQAVDMVNRLAPEHLELMVQHPFEWLGRIRHAGAIFLGAYSAEVIGDYFAGPNHVLPTNGTARFSSPLGVDDFVKKSSIIRYSKQDLERNAQHIMQMAKYEGLEGHARAIQIRVSKEDEA